MYLSATITFCVFYTILAQNSSRNFNSACGQVFTQKQFIIESPNYPGSYPLNYQCSYLIKGPSCPTWFSLQFLDFTVEESLGCAKDRLEIDDQDAICGNRTNENKEYFSEKGTLIVRFVSDSTNSKRGYRILITRSSCQNSEVTTSVPKWHTTHRDVEYTTTTKPLNKAQCCPTSFRSKRFTLTSPNFPNSMAKETDCVFEIYKSNPNICRLRINLEFFWLARSLTDCTDGFLEIDDKKICGCKSELKIIAPFGSKSTKVLRFKSLGKERSSYSGFVMNVVQDECPNKVVPQEPSIQKGFKFYNDQINRVAWPHNNSGRSFVEKLHLIGENTEVLDSKENDYGLNQPQIIKHFYFFAPKDPEETEYLDTSSSNTFEDSVDYNYCRNWNQFKFNSLSLKKLSVCRTSEGSVSERKCVDVDLKEQRGFFKSPGYPFYYPGNMNLCYRFHKLPGYCEIRVHMKDFQLQNGNGCENDYLVFANKLRYCGDRLANTISTLDLRNKLHQQMNFVTDSFYCGRGFFGSYEQVPCQEFPYPINPITQTPPHFPRAMPCSRTVQEEMFTFEVYDYHAFSCSLIVKKYSEKVCFVTIYFENFDLSCSVESLVIDETMYCGRLTGQSVKIDVTTKDPLIVYKKMSNAGVAGLRLRLKGVQESDDCAYPEVPAERFLNVSPVNQTHNNTQFLLKMKNNFKELCGVITKRMEAEAPNTFCEILMQNDGNVTDCLPLTENSLFIPHESQKIELKIRAKKKLEQITFQVIDCEKITSSNL